jgi:hypothetical protein
MQKRGDPYFYICFLLNNYQYEITQKSFIPMRFNHNDRI